jgi:integrase
MSPQKSSKGKVSIEVKNGYLRLRWRYLGTQHTLYTGLPDEPVSRTVAESKANAIALDMLSNNFDKTLAKYKPQKAKPKPENRSPLDLYLEFLEFRRSAGFDCDSEKYESLTEGLKRDPKPEKYFRNTEY